MGQGHFESVRCLAGRTGQDAPRLEKSHARDQGTSRAFDRNARKRGGP